MLIHSIINNVHMCSIANKKIFFTNSFLDLCNSLLKKTTGNKPLICKYSFFRMSIIGCDTEIKLSPNVFVKQTSLPNVVPGDHFATRTFFNIKIS